MSRNSRPSPPYSATDYPGEMMEGNDGNMYISEKRGAARSFRWYKASGYKPSRRRSIKKVKPKSTSIKKGSNRKSPSDSSKEHPDKKMKGLDGNMYISEKRGAAKSYRWYKIPKETNKRSVKKKLKKAEKSVRRKVKKQINFDHLLDKPCADPEKIRNPKTGKCISASGPTAKKLGLSGPKNDGRDLKKILGGISTPKKKSLKKQRKSLKIRKSKKIRRSLKSRIKRKMSKVKEVAIVGKVSSPKKVHVGPRTMPGYKYKHPKGVSVILAKNFDKTKHNVKGWWLSEKLDGIRAYWDSNEGEFFTRNGNVIYAPNFFVENLPKNVNLDGELWIGRGKEDFNLMSGISRRIPYKIDGSKSKTYNPKDWEQVKYLVFDAPDYPGPYEDRVEYYHKVIKKLKNKHVVPVETWPAKSNEHVIEERIRIEDMGGEGIMLRKPGSKYDKRRSNTLLKVKSFMDAEARVIGHNKGSGKYSDVLGALIMETIKKENDPKGMKNGVQFTLSGMNDYQRVNYKNIFPIGTIITYKYFQLSKDSVPRFPSFIAIRGDD
jgi:DNA ligase-1